MVQRYNPDYVMHAARFAPFAREAEHGEFVKFSDYEALVSELASSRQINAQTLQVKLTMAETIKELTERVNALAVENAALNKSLDDVCDAYENGQRDLLSEAIDKAINLPSPATDAALAAIQAQGVEKAAAALDALSAQPASATTQANFRAAAVYLRSEVLPAIGEAK
ncbi:hypothetical protein L8N14_006895 [Serratia marcescens]|uniref:hypothetical protein n=1 Tax=Serratia marcescens TaxID=615 RepID=UPI001C97B400|nr:hypothetical protein [Serratia marcescens]MBY4847788.1 hypothetical protein [Serratia marcescens]MCH9865794.1 hypothetical protein [Serratia marcescens]